VDFRADSIRHRVRSPENSQAGAKAYEAVLRRKFASEEPVKPAIVKATFASFSDQWFETYVRTNNKPSSQKSRKQILTNHLLPYFGAYEISAISPGRIEQYKNQKQKAGLSPKSINMHLGVLSKRLNDAVEWGQLAIAPRLRYLRQPRPPFRFLSREEAKRLVAAMPEGRYRTMTILACHTGLRIGEVLALQWDDISFTNRHLVVRRSIVDGIIGTTKNNRERQVPLSTAVIFALESLPHDNAWLFHQTTGAPLTYGMAQHAIAMGGRRTGLRPIGWHALRHSFASWLVGDGVPIPVVQGLLGHSTIEMTMRYAHLAPSAFRNAIQVLENSSSNEAPEFSWATGGQPASVLAI
jgi:integrase